jgi:S1-C subfamily serine protease
MGDGYLITAKHVVVDCNSVDFYINYYDGKNEKVTEKQIRLSDSTDLAEIKIKRNYGRTLRIVSYPLTRGEPIYLAGHPWEKRTLFLSRGIVSSEREWFTFRGGVTTEGRMLDAHVVPGCSGCPVFTEYDYVAGVAVGVGGMITIMVDNMDLLAFINER